MALCGDLDGDGFADVLVGAPREDLVAADAGVARALSGATGCRTYTWCTAKINSQGCLPALGASGSPSLSGPGDLVVRASQLLNRSVGLFVASTQADRQPALGGTLCLAPPLVHLALLATGGNPSPPDCSGALLLALPPSALVAHGWTAGTTVHLQAWSRDPPHPDGTGAGLSDALSFVLCP